MYINVYYNNNTHAWVGFNINMLIHSVHSRPKVLPKESLSQVGSTCLQTGPAVRHPTTQSWKKQNMTQLFQPNRVKATKTSKRKAIHAGLPNLRWWMNGRKWPVMWIGRIVFFTQSVSERSEARMSRAGMWCVSVISCLLTSLAFAPWGE